MGWFRRRRAYLPPPVTRDGTARAHIVELERQVAELRAGRGPYSATIWQLDGWKRPGYGPPPGWAEGLERMGPEEQLEHLTGAGRADPSGCHTFELVDLEGVRPEWQADRLRRLHLEAHLGPGADHNHYQLYPTGGGPQDGKERP